MVTLARIAVGDDSERCKERWVVAITLRNRGILDGTGIAIGVAVGIACLSAAGAALVVARARRSVASQPTAADAAPALQPRAADPARFRHTSHTSELASSLDPSDVLDRTLDAVVALPGIDAALVAIRNEGDAPPTTRSAGLSEDEIERTLLQMPNHPDLRALEIIYRYRLDDVGALRERSLVRR